MDVRNLVKSAAVAHDDEKARQIQARAAEDAPRLARVDASIATLKNRLSPLLEKVAQDLSAERIDTELAEKFDVRNRAVFVAPTVELRLLGPARRSDGYRFKSPLVVFAADGETITASHSMEKHALTAGKIVGSAKGDEIEPLLERTLASALPLYFEELDDWEMVRQI